MDTPYDITDNVFTWNAWRRTAGLPEIELNGRLPDTVSELLISQRSTVFEKMRANRMVFGAYRYGKVSSNGNSGYKRIASVIKRLELYQNNGNLEMLVDAANLLELEFMLSEHPNKHMADEKHNLHVEK